MAEMALANAVTTPPREPSLMNPAEVPGRFPPNPSVIETPSSQSSQELSPVADDADELAVKPPFADLATARRPAPFPSAPGSPCRAGSSQEEFRLLRETVIQLVELRGEGAWKTLRYDLEVGVGVPGFTPTNLPEPSRFQRFDP